MPTIENVYKVDAFLFNNIEDSIKFNNIYNNFKDEEQLKQIYLGIKNKIDYSI